MVENSVTKLPSEAESAGPEDVVHELGRFLSALACARASDLVTVWGGANLTVVQLRALGRIAAHPDGLSGRELAHELGVGPSAITALADRLAEHGFVRREEDRSDRRVTRLVPTDRGLEAVQRFSSLRADTLRAIADELSPTDRARVARALRRLSAAAEDVLLPAAGQACSTTGSRAGASAAPHPAPTALDDSVPAA